MPRAFRCMRCGKLMPGPSMPSICTRCGNASPADFEEAAPKIPNRVEIRLAGAIEPYWSIHRDECFGRAAAKYLCSAAGTDAYKFVSDHQVEFFKRDEGWAMRAAPTALNGSFANGAELTGGVETYFDSDVTLFIGNPATGNGVTFAVTLV